MRTLILSLLLFCFDLSYGQVLQGTSTYNITAGGGTVTLANYQITTQINVGTNGSVTLVAPYTLGYTSLPSVGAHWNVYCDFTNLTTGSNAVTIFGKTPLTDWNGTPKFYIAFWVANNATGTPTLYSYYYSNLVQLPTVINLPITFNQPVTFNTASIGVRNIPNLSNSVQNDTIIVRNGDTLATVYGTPWWTGGNAGTTAGTNFVGTTDGQDLVFKIYGVQAGLLDSANNNTAIGLRSLIANTSGGANVAYGTYSLYANTTGSNSTAIGFEALSGQTTGNNTSVGCFSSQGITTGSGNTAVGRSALHSLPTTGSNNTAIGGNATVTGATTTGGTSLGYNTTSDSYGTAIGYGATASPNQIAITGRSFYFSGLTNCLNCILADSTGSGNFIPKSIGSLFQKTDYVPVTGDSISPTTYSNLIKPSGTLANLTIRLPASPSDGMIMEFSTSKTLTALHWSTALNQTNVVDANVPTTLVAGSGVYTNTVRIQYDLASTTWYNW